MTFSASSSSYPGGSRPPMAASPARDAALPARGLGLVTMLVVALAACAAPGRLQTDDRRFSLCDWTNQPVVAAFSIAHAADYLGHLPRMRRSAELETASPAFVVVFSEPFEAEVGERPGAPPPTTLGPNDHDVCVWVGDVIGGEAFYYRNVDVTGMRP